VDSLREITTHIAARKLMRDNSRSHVASIWATVRMYRLFGEWRLSNFSQDASRRNVLYRSATKTFRLALRPITSAFHSLPVYSGNEATLGQSRSVVDTVGTVPCAASRHTTQWKSTVEENEW